jgi:hypothetical protein
MIRWDGVEKAYDAARGGKGLRMGILLNVGG